MCLAVAVVSGIAMVMLGLAWRVMLHKMELVAMQGWILLHSCVTSVTEMS